MASLLKVVNKNYILISLVFFVFLSKSFFFIFWTENYFKNEFWGGPNYTIATMWHFTLYILENVFFGICCIFMSGKYTLIFLTWFPCRYLFMSHMT